MLAKLRQKRSTCGIAHSFKYFSKYFIVHIFNHGQNFIHPFAG